MCPQIRVYLLSARMAIEILKEKPNPRLQAPGSGPRFPRFPRFARASARAGFRRGQAAQSKLFKEQRRAVLLPSFRNRTCSRTYREHVHSTRAVPRCAVHVAIKRKTRWQHAPRGLTRGRARGRGASLRIEQDYWKRTQLIAWHLRFWTIGLRP